MDFPLTVKVIVPPAVMFALLVLIDSEGGAYPQYKDKEPALSKDISQIMWSTD